MRQKALETNTHHHTKTCRKHEPDSRFRFPRPHSEYTIIAQEMSKEVMKAEDETVKSLAYIMGEVKAELKIIEEDLKLKRMEDKTAEIEGTLHDMLNRLFPDVSMTDEEFIIIQDGNEEHKIRAALVQKCWKQNPDHEERPISPMSPKKWLQSAIYHNALSIISHGTKVVLKRHLKDIFVNNFNVHWMLVWNGNMDVQSILDYFSCVTYMTDYVCKPEKKTTELLKDVKNTKKKEGASTRDQMYALAQAYLTSREMGECEAYYKLEPSLHYKQSNVKTVFIASGFPHNRSKFLRKCNTEADTSKGFTVDGHEGKFLETESIHSKYSMRPASIEKLSLCQMGMRYTQVPAAEPAKIRRLGRSPAP